MKTTLTATTFLSILLFTSTAAKAAIIYGDFTGTTVMYLAVTESNATDVQKFGAPNIFGDQLDFNPTNFRAQSSGAAVIEDSQLNTTVMSRTPNNPITEIQIRESGDYTLAGLGAAQAVATVGTNVQFTIVNTDGTPIAPQVCASNGVQLVFEHENPSIPSTGSFSLPSNLGTAVPWKGSLDYDVAALLASCGLTGNVTKVDVVLDNTLTATAAGGGSAFIAKKDFRGLTITVPEPTSAGLLLTCLAPFAAIMRRRIWS